MAESTTIAGTVKFAKKPAAGARVALLRCGTDIELARTFTLDTGFFIIKLRVCDEARTLAAKGLVDLIVSDATGWKIATSQKVTVDRGATIRINLKAKNEESYKPVQTELPRRSGGLFDPQVTRILAAGERFVARDKDAVVSVDRFLPPVAKIADLLDMAWRVIDGSYEDAERFRVHLEALRRVGNVATLDADDDEPLHAGLLRCIELESADVPVAGIVPVPSDRLAPIVAAIVAMSPTEAVMRRHLRSLEDGLEGVGHTAMMVQSADRMLKSGNPIPYETDRQPREILDKPPLDPTDRPLRDGRPTRPDREAFRDRRPYREVSREVREQRACLHDFLDFLIYQSMDAPRYHIESMTPNEGLPGDTIIIEGDGFGDIQGYVVFNHVEPYHSDVFGGVETWTDSRIEVTVPENAGTGTVRLRIHEATYSMCGKTHQLYRLPVGDLPWFTTLLVRMLRLWLHGGPESRSGYVRPHETFEISWQSTPGEVTIMVRDGNGAVVMTHPTLETSGSIDCTVPAGTGEQTFSVRAEVTAPEGTDHLTETIRVTVDPALTLFGAEISQGIQHFWGPDETTWNTLPVIADKETIVRCYIGADRDGFNNDQVEVTGTIFVNNTPLYPINGVTPVSNAGNPFITAGPRATIDREQTDHTLNFRIPAALCKGSFRFHVKMIAQNSFGDLFEFSKNVPVAWQTNAALRVRFVRIEDQSHAAIVPPPTTEQCRFTIERAFDLFPSPPSDIGPARTPLWVTTRDFTNSDDDLRDLLDDLDDEHNCDAWEAMWEWTGATDCPNEDHAKWVGLSLAFNRGWGKWPGNTCISAIYKDEFGSTDTLRYKTAHELGHNLDMDHVNVNGAPGDYYNHPNGGYLQEVAFDPYWNKAIPLSNLVDIMGYGSPRWTSADSWLRLINKI
ncbi:MAG: hypothetical protein KJ630_16440 [Proteobacteria bacterium]|nr:hypothetical protein [Pseudomonadota bacterium]